MIRSGRYRATDPDDLLRLWWVYQRKAQYGGGWHAVTQCGEIAELGSTEEDVQRSIAELGIEPEGEGTCASSPTLTQA